MIGRKGIVSSSHCRLMDISPAGGKHGSIYPGTKTKIVFEKGTVINFPNFARVIGNFDGVIDGESFHHKFGK